MSRSSRFCAIVLTAAVVLLSVAVVLSAWLSYGWATAAFARREKDEVLCERLAKGVLTYFMEATSGSGVAREWGTFEEAPAVTAEPTGYGGAMVDAHEKSKRLKCRNNLKQIGLALFMYRQTNDGKWPRDLETLIDKRYLTTRKVLQCPSARSPAGSVDYVLVRTKGKKGKPRKFDPGDIIVYDRKGNHKDGRNVLQFDQQVLWLSEEQFKKRMGNEPYQ